MRLSRPPEPVRVVCRVPIVGRLPSSESTRGYDNDAAHARGETWEAGATIADAAMAEYDVADGAQESAFNVAANAHAKLDATEVSEADATIAALDAPDDGAQASEAAPSAPEPTPDASEQVDQAISFTHDERIDALRTRPTASTTAAFSSHAFSCGAVHVAREVSAGGNARAKGSYCGGGGGGGAAVVQRRRRPCQRTV